MSETRRCDLVVAGLGPAGSSAAEAAAKAGLHVIAIDRKKTAGVPVQCAEFIPGPLYGHVANLDQVTHQPIAAMETVIEVSSPYHSPDFRGGMIDRARFDALLAEKAAEAGAETIFGTRAVALEADGLHLLDGTVLDAPIMIGADGPRSQLGEAIGSVNADLVETRQITAPLLRAHDATDIFLSADYKGGYAWLFPRGTHANVGLGVVPSERHRLKGLLDDLRDQLIAEGRIGPEVSNVTGGSIPTGGLLAPIGAANGHTILLAGDAAGLTNPVTGAGIASAVQSGRMAGEAAAALHHGEPSAGEDYRDELFDVFGPSLERAVMRRCELLRAYANGGLPDGPALRQGWIAFPEYWSVSAADDAPHDERQYA
ncbi:MAG: NAD(P)/FAD-dependent oxidoreductase, partial [Pseudomonadota bacterium]